MCYLVLPLAQAGAAASSRPAGEFVWERIRVGMEWHTVREVWDPKTGRLKLQRLEDVEEEDR